jgi:hypothetical protein
MRHAHQLFHSLQSLPSSQHPQRLPSLSYPSISLLLVKLVKHFCWMLPSYLQWSCHTYLALGGDKGTKLRIRLTRNGITYFAIRKRAIPLLRISEMAYICSDMRYVVLSLIGAALVYGQCNQCMPDSARSPRLYGFNPSVLRLPPNKDTSLTIYFTFPDSVRVVVMGNPTLVYPNYAIWVDSLRLDQGRITTQDGGTFAYNASNPAAGPIHFDQMHRYKQWGSGATDYANFVVYKNPATPTGGEPGNTPPIGCARVCIRTSSTEGSDTLRVKVRAFIPTFGDGEKDTTNLRPVLLGNNAWLDTVFRYAVVISSAPASLGSGMSAMYVFRPVSNPAYREAVVTYTLPQPMAVRLRAYTLDGREVLLRDLGLQPAGTFQETLNLPAGQYFLRLETPYGLSTSRLTVIE